VNCYICRSSRSKLLFNKNNYDIHECKNCGFIYLPNISKKIILEYYKKFDYKNNEIEENIIRKDALRTIHIIKKIIHSDARILDMGCGRGYLLDEAKHYFHNIYGVDYSKYAVSYARKVLKLHVKIGNIEKIQLQEKFDLIILNQVIEHVTNPNLLLKNCLLHLNKSGYIYITTPNIKSIFSKYFNEKYQYYMPPEHCGYYDIDSIINILYRNNLKIIRIKTWTYPNDIAGYIKSRVKSDLNNNNNNLVVHDTNNINMYKKIKYYIFDVIICRIIMPIFNLKNNGTNLEVIAQKV